MSTIYTVEGNTSGGSTVVANGGGVAKKYYTNFSRVKEIVRPNYRKGELEKCVAEKLKWIGYLEKRTNEQLESFTGNAGKNNYTIFADHAYKETGSGYFVNGVYWCVQYQEDTNIRALGTKRALELQGGNWTAVCSAMSAGLQRAGGKKVSVYEAKRGDYIFFKDSKGDYCHIGFVIDEKDYYGVTQENKVNSTSTSSTTSKIQQARINFIKSVQTTCGAKVDGIAGAETLSKTITVSTIKNSKHKVVKAIQVYLNALGYKCGVADGIYGKNTKSAVISFQKDNGCVSDGIITAKAKTWKKLLGM